MRSAFFSLIAAASAILASGTTAAVTRPPITGIANFVVKTDSLDEARKFYSGVLGYDEVFRHKRAIAGPAEIAVFKVNDHQYIELAPTLEKESDDKLIQIGFETADARKLRDYLASRGVGVPARVSKDSDSNYSFVVKDPEGHNVEFVEYTKGSLQSKYRGKALSDRRISDHILHVGVHVKSPEAQDKFYKDILGFRFLWQGGPRDDRLDWISLLTPDGDNWIEYMVMHDGPPTPQQLGVWHHVCVGTLDMQAVYKTVMDRGYKPPREPSVARDGRMLLQLYDKHNTRTEVMIRKPVQKPCCSENMDPYIK
ncbi:MAG TPA: VOC family protein [Candidatus Acidoferrales bacterium]|nr:VOC family protein [Candidatus Acidoferrales bacterium]HTS66384.1 VOC family protein [Candidatus Acidoferrales bacterium]